MVNFSAVIDEDCGWNAGNQTFCYQKGLVQLVQRGLLVHEVQEKLILGLA